ncbi:MAG: Si-specific NAD(P)(+) transhydrogenase, partial [Planctomycetota bacterium]
MQTYDLAVIGLGPAGHFGAIQAAKLGKRVVAIEAAEDPGGAAAITGTVPSKSLREATLHLTGLRQRTHYGAHYRVKDDVTFDDLIGSTAKIIRHETGVLRDQLRR